MDFKEDISKDFQIDYSVKLGEGAFGDVFRGIWKQKKCFVAVKRIKQHISNAKQVMDEEVKVMENMKHQNILNFLAVIKSQKGTFLVIQFCEGGSLQKQIQKGIPQLDCFLYLKQIVDGMCAVNKKNHIHRDIKPENILFTKQKILKICDFGLARKIAGDDVNAIQKFSAKGTPLFSAPQILRHQKYSGKCDVWSTGTLLVQMLTKRNPFYQAKNIASLINIQQKLREEPYALEGKFNPWFKEIISHMIQYNEDKRWSFYQVQQQINKDYSKIMKQFGRLDAIQTTKITKQNVKGAQSETGYYEVPDTNNLQKMNVFNKHNNKIESYQSQTTQESHNEGNYSKIEKKLIAREENKKLLISLKSYVEFLYNRGKLFADVGTKYFQTKQNPKANGYKFIVLFLSIASFLKCMRKLRKLIQQQKFIILPDKVKFDYNELDQASQKQFQAYQKDYQKQMKDQTDKFIPTINQITAKMFSDKYKKQYSKLINNNQDILNELNNLNSDKCNQSVEYFERKFKQFFEMQCLENDIDSVHEGFLRVYWICLNLANINQTIPVARYKQNYIINQLVDDSAKLPIDKIRASVKKFHSQIK